MKTMTLVLGALLLAVHARAVTCPAGVTHIVGTVPRSDGSAAAGTITVSGPTVQGGNVPFDRQTVTIAAGAVDFCLVGGPGYRYDAIYELLVGGTRIPSYTERWIVPATTNVMTIQMLWGGSSAPQFLVSPQQINPAGLSAGQVWVWNGTAYAPGSGGGGTSGGINGTSLWSEIEAGTAPSGTVTGTMTWAAIEAGG